MREPRRLAIVRDYGELHQALRARADELNVSRETLDSVSGLHNGYVSKLLAPVPIKSLGPTSLGPLLGAMGLVLVVVEDVEMLERLRGRLVKREIDPKCSRHAHDRKAKKTATIDPAAWGKIMTARRLLILSPSTRSEIARKAANARWRKANPRRQAKCLPES